MKPEIDESSFVAKSAVIIGNVKIGKNCGIYPNAVIRGDQNPITIEDGTNIQDCAVIHTDKNHKVKIGKNVSIGHNAVVHGATIQENVLVGMNATIMNGSKIGKGSIIGANALITTDKIIPEYSLVMGVPGKILKHDQNYYDIAKKNAEEYHKLTKEHLNKKYEYYNKDK
jgi:carbonic anhydrase/acetyltransferase-like protein (isoleucine patch superfamily)